MATKAEQRQWRDAVEEVLNATEAAERYQQRQREMRRGRARSGDGPRPREFDEGGFPLPQPVSRFTSASSASSMAERIARRLTSTGLATRAYWTAITATVMLLLYMGWVA